MSNQLLDGEYINGRGHIQKRRTGGCRVSPPPPARRDPMKLAAFYALDPIGRLIESNDIEQLERVWNAQVLSKSDVIRRLNALDNFVKEHGFIPTTCQ